MGGGEKGKVYIKTNMGTRSTVKFYDEGGGEKIAVYQQYDGYVEGVGRQIVDLIKKIEIKNGFGGGDKIFEVANGIDDLALQYIAMYKTEVGNLYATDFYDTQEFDYEIYGGKSFLKEDITIKVYNRGEEIFAGGVGEFEKFVEERENA